MTASPQSTAPALQCQREAFALPEELHYLNCAYMSPLARRVEAAGVAGLQRKRAPNSIVPADFFADGNEVRERFARLIGANRPTQIAILPSVSYGIALAASNVSLAPGQSILLVGEQFPSNVYMWRRVATESGASVRLVARPDPATNETLTDALLAAIDDTTAVVSIGSVYWTDGVVPDVVTIGERARQVGAAYVLDGTQSIGALPFDVDTVRPDALVVGGYKWLLGPYGIALAYFGDRFGDAVPIEEPWIVRSGSEDFRQLVDYRDEYRPDALRFDAGGMSNFITVPMLLAALNLLHEWTVPAIQSYCAALIAPLRDAADAREWPISEGASHIVGIQLPAAGDLDELRRRLEAANVSVSLRGSAIRVSPHVYNDDGDLTALIEVLDQTLS